VFKRFVFGCLLVLMATLARAQSPALYQYSTLEALSSGVFAGDLSVSELLAKGDFGLGTFNGLNGEMVVLNGQAWRANPDCTLVQSEASDRIPFADVTFFKPQGQEHLPKLDNLAGLAAWLDSKLPGPRVFAAAKISGSFASLTLRSPSKQSPPFPTLAQALASQHVRHLSNVSGTIVAIRCPKDVGDLAVPGWHFHFISQDEALGGHVLEAGPDQATASWMVLRRVELALPQGGAFDQTKPGTLNTDEIMSLEGAQPISKP